MPSISVVHPTKIRPDEITRMLRSLREQQDDAARSHRRRSIGPSVHPGTVSQLVHLHDLKIGGLTAALNRGVNIARGDVMLFFDDDGLPEVRSARAYRSIEMVTTSVF
jgi:glycosyltransferase involved in cell wall biosynthesis